MNIADQTFPAVDSANEDRAQAIRDQLRDAIVDRRLAPGTKLSEGEVGTLFDVSRTVARAALQMLSFEGLVRTERNRGAFVANPSPEEARQVFASRRLIEPGIAIAAAGRMTPNHVAAFTAQLDEEGRFIAERGPNARRSEIKASGDFHLLLASVAGNAILQRFMEELVARSSLVIALYGRSGVSSCGHSEHMNILEALENGNSERASALMLHHIDHIEADLDLRVRSGPALRQALEF
ncbi:MULTISPECIES: GntR family transcriptional regulator [unclassified Mesorhizobium]|uniref:GntR family transcriptional regulator n=1 Tax=unclassified Mesorhizobium TaxID=325217 RepID=UPI000FD43080|nr:MULTISPECIES: GntR family transcriptional regulator [unclassified Mesorhizobium]RUV74492.1 GntR family transcriptional regulator [Mesorhizobium sp. M5C.F.Ca.IN.020.14.1.1]RUV29537.1 GntR family transcriptional regulator [Mesorhizobium sp. M5C.F.Ca.IN.020.32.2.1]RWC43923.1 MAG: GntR family transcriptional regulator [Mesorhizobium sp.]RWE99554.1 MAG: GntR family transcriptional regulator [Mesorhizobium sp.]RWG50175.1 MAG: GntR family transcriptional regulator [Mesorhizobium sp.]